MMPRRSVALLIDTSSGYCRGLLDGVIAFMKECGNWSVHLEQSVSDRPPAWLKSWGGDGIIARIDTDQFGQQLKTYGVPVVDLSAARHVKGIPWADTDDRAIAQIAIEHFTERGFRHLAYCGDAGFEWSRRRGRHFRELATASDCTLHEHESSPRTDEAFNPEHDVQKLVQWMKDLPRPIAIMACYDFKAHQILDACHQLKIAVPEEVAILGVDDDRILCELSEPTLSSIVPNTRQTGYSAASLLNRMMMGEQVSTMTPIITQPLGIHVRESTDTLAVEDTEIVKALQFIRRHAVENIRVADILPHVNLSRRALEHRFRKLLGHTPHEEIQRVRMNRIRALLSETELSIQEIATRTGFDYGEYMAVAFKRENGITPSEYRTRYDRPPTTIKTNIP